METRTLIVTLGAGELAALDVATGEIVWRKRFGSLTCDDFVVHRGKVYAVITESHLHCLDHDTGRVEWTTRIPGQSNDRHLFRENDALYIETVGNLACFELDGSLRWSQDMIGDRAARLATAAEVAAHLRFVRR